MLDKKVAELINTQVNKEFYSAYLYLDFANYYKDAELNGFSNWYQVQAQEERDHAMLFIQYLQNNGEKITLEAIAKPDRVFVGLHGGPLTAGLEHENYVTGLSMIFMTPRIPLRISVPCSFWTGSQRSRAKRRRTPVNW